MSRPFSARPSTCAQFPSEPLAGTTFDAAERALLTVARHYFRSFAAPETQSWIAAVGAAIQSFGHDRAPDLVVATLAAVHAMRRTRTSVFHFNDPCCAYCAARITRHERAWLGALAETRDRRIGRASGHAVILCEGADHTPFLQAMNVLAIHLPPRVAA